MRNLKGILRAINVCALIFCAFLTVQGQGSASAIKRFGALQWRPVGPFRGGRAVAVSGVIGRPKTFYFGAAGGGLWKTTNGGKDWKNVSDGFFKTSGVGAIAVAPSDPNVVYVGMGETNIRNDITPGDGVYKSTDGGETWTNMGLKKTQFISKIVVDPRNPDILLVAALGHVFGDNKERGVYKSTDGGKNWKKALYKNNKTGAIDLVMNPGNARILYAALWQAYRKPWKLSSGGAGSGIYKSTDEGETWTELRTNPGLPKGLLGKIGLAVSYQHQQRVFAIIEAKHGGVFRSNDAGKTWKLINDNNKLTLRPWYYSKIYVNPDDDNKLYVLDEGFYNSVDGGKSFHAVATPHGDNHTMWINPTDGKTMIESNDGGANVSYDGGKRWTEQDLNIGQFYHVNFDNGFPYHLYGAQQDFGSISIKSRTKGFGITAKDWQTVAGGESGYVVPQPGKPWITYGGGYEGDLERNNKKTEQSYAISPWPVDQDGEAAAKQKYRFNWTFPIMISPFDANKILIGSQYVMQSTDEGRHWNVISPDLTRDDSAKQQPSGGPLTIDETGTTNYDTIFSLAESPVKKGVIWAGTDDGLIHLTTDGGNSWKKVSPKNLPPWSLISIIEPSHFDAATAFVAVNRLKEDDLKPYFYKTTDYGKHWKNITKSIPEDDFARVIRQDPVQKNLLYAGTEHGIWVSFNSGEKWQPLQENLPVTSVRDIRIQKRENDLVIATHGRGFWIMDHLKPLREIAEGKVKGNLHLFAPERAYLSGGYRYSSANATVGQNPESGATFFYYLPQPADSLSLRIATAAGDSVATFTTAGKKKSPFYNKQHSAGQYLPDSAGTNRFTWNLRYPNVTEVKGIDSGTGYSSKGPKVAPGNYIITLQKGSQKQKQSLKVVPDPRNNTSQADFEARQQLLMKVYHGLDATNKAVNRIESLRNQINDYTGKLNDATEAKKLRTMAEVVKESLDVIEAGFIQKKIHTNEDVLRYPVQLHTKFSDLQSTIESSPARPTPAMQQTYQMLDKKLRNLQQRLKMVIEMQIPTFNEKVESLGLDVPVYLENR